MPYPAVVPRGETAPTCGGARLWSMSTVPVVDDPSRNYGDRIAAVEPGGVEFIPLDERHGRPLQMLWTWTSPNMEFATVGVGILATAFFGLTFWQAVWAI